MAIPLHKAVTSVEAIIASIKTDRYVYRWFSYLIVHPAVKAQLKQSLEMSRFYHDLQRQTCLQVIVYVGQIFFLYYLIIAQQWLALIPIVLLTVLPFYLSHRKMDLVAKISIQALTKDYSNDQIARMTLFHICEIYSRKLHIPSLVDTIYAMDSALRRTIIWTFVFTVFIYPLAFWQMLLCLWATYFMIRLIVNLTYFYKRLA